MSAANQMSCVLSTTRGPGFLNNCFLSLITLLAVLGAPGFGLAQIGPIRQPVGIYARILIQGTNAQTNNINGILTNTAIAGILAVFNWDDVSFGSPTNSKAGTNEWGIMDNLFNMVGNYNSNNPGGVPKTIQLEITPGFHTPAWVFSNLPPCDAMFLTDTNGDITTNNADGTPVLIGVDTNNVTNNCGCAMFLEAEDFASPTVLPLPLPWNPFYTNAWGEFIQAVAARYGNNPALVSVAIAGPTSSSAEMILPNEKNDPTNYLKWNPIIALEFPDHPKFTNSDTLFIKAWEGVIDLYSACFSNVTLAVTTGNGLPNFLDSNGDPYTNNYSVPPGFTTDCGQSNTNAGATIMDCAAETTILAYFADPQHGGINAKAAQEDGTSAAGVHTHAMGGGDLGGYGIKWLAQNTTSGNAPLPGTTNIVSRVLAGLQVGGNMGMAAITEYPNAEGCPLVFGTCSGISPEQGVYNVLATYFDGTPFGSNYGYVSSNFTLNYFQIYSADAIYADTNTIGSSVTDGSGNSNNMTAYMLFSNANFQISQLAEHNLALDVQMVGQNVQLTWLATTPPAYQLEVTHDLSRVNGWKLAPQQSTNFIGDYYQVTITPNAVESYFRLAPP